MASMGLSRSIAEQLARPTGSAGRVLGRVMNVANRKPTRLAIELLAPRPGERILDAGCGTGAAMAKLLDHAPCRAFGIDPSRAMLDAAARKLSGAAYRGRYELHRAGMEDMPFMPGSFDAALALNVLYFCDAEGTMLGSIRRALRPGGRLIAYVTHCETMVRWPFARAGCHRLFDGAGLADMAGAAGFAPGNIAVHDVTITRSVRGLLLRAVK